MLKKSHIVTTGAGNLVCWTRQGFIENSRFGKYGSYEANWMVRWLDILVSWAGAYATAASVHFSGWYRTTGARAAIRQLGQQFQVPYRLTETNHFLVRARINGKGPFNFLVDSGAPALFIATETAKKIGIKPDPARVLDADRSP